MQLPSNITDILDALERSGHEAYIVGGCVRDSLMGLPPHDYDVTTSALPEEIKSVFSHLRTVDKGIKHGTVTVISEGVPVEVTTYRIDGEYHDSRRPDSVCFTRSLQEDIARRDFTMNGIAYSPTRGLRDEFGGAEDIRARIIRCIGDPDRRFSEDALRILRALRFASVLGFSVEEHTADSLRRSAPLLDRISAERVFSELTRLLCGGNVRQVLTEFPEVFTRIIPELSRCVGYEQGSRWHSLTLYEHMAAACAAAPPAEEMRLAMLLHDIAKPDVHTTDSSGEAHYYGHAGKSAETADAILRRLRCDNALREKVCRIIKYHDMTPENTPKSIRRQLSKHGEEMFRCIMAAHIADDSAKTSEALERVPLWEEIIRRSRETAAQQPCLAVKDLAVNGRDLAELTPPSPLTGETLKYLLSRVVDEALPNEREILLEEAAKYIAKSRKL